MVTVPQTSQKPQYVSITYMTTKSVEQTISAVKSTAKGSLLIIDLDETLFLRNSSQAYLNCIYPRVFGTVFLTVMKALKPWRLFPGPYKKSSTAKDWFLIVLATLLFPWTPFVWRSQAKKLAEAYCNTELAEAIDASEASLVIATRGFDFIVNPLIRHLPMSSVQSGQYQVVACRFWQGIIDRATSKLEMVAAAVGPEAISNSTVVTDSDVDAQLLDASKTPCLVVWPGAAFIPAMSDVYLPLFYSEKVKNPGRAHCLKQVLLGHWLYCVIAWSCLSPHPAINAVSVLLLTLSYWCVYEIGYQENDTVGEKYEAKPTLSKTYNQYKSRINLHTPLPWLWAAGLAIPGCILFAVSQIDAPLGALTGEMSVYLSSAGNDSIWPVIGRYGLLWMGYLGLIRGTFWIYNQLNETTRMWVYPVLQAQRLTGFAIFAHTSVVGTVLLMSYVVSRWIQYCIYRCGGDRTRFPTNVSALLLFTLLYVVLLLNTPDKTSLLTGQAAVAFIYCAFRSAGKVRQIRTSLGWLKKDSLPGKH